MPYVLIQEKCPDAVINKTKGFCVHSNWDGRACICGISHTPVYNKDKRAHLYCPYAYRYNPDIDTINLFTGEPLKKMSKRILEMFDD